MNDPNAENMSGEEVVISGISGRFPSSRDIHQFMTNLYDKVDMVESSETYWDNFNHPDVPKYVGRIKGLEYFDNNFFKVSSAQSEHLDSIGRKVLELTYEAIFDAGVNPVTLSGKNIGVFIGYAFDDISYLNMFRDGTKYSKYNITGSNKSMLANRISYWLDLKGPSFALNSCCSSSTATLTTAYRYIKSGYCDAAIVAGCNYCPHPIPSLNMKRAGYLCADGKTKCFDKNGDGFVRSEAISVLFLQKSKHARRIYTEIFYADEKYFASPNGMFLPHRNSGELQIFFKEIYKNANVIPEAVEYVEANSEGLKDADAEELDAINNFFSRDDVLMVGSVKSNIGHTEAASGICGVTKLCFSYHTGNIPGNLHYKEPLDNSEIRNGRIQILTDNTPFNRGFTALNSFSYTGLNYHIIMKGHYKPKDLTKYTSSIPRLVIASGRTEPCVQKIINLLKTAPIDPEQIALLLDIFGTNISGHLARGYAIFDSNTNNETRCIAENVSHYPDMRGPVWFLYSGMGSQWAGMGKELMQVPAFAAVIEKCHKILSTKGINIVNIITDMEEAGFDNIINSFVGITAIQIALTDVLKELGIVPDNIIGHSVGEISCAYADGSLTAEECILSSYYRGLVSYETEFIPGLMAAVKLGHEKVKTICPPEIEAVCHNSSESTTISGPEAIVKNFVKELISSGIFAKEVNTSNIAYHSKYIAHAAPRLLTEMRNVITNPKLRSKKWISTSVPPAKHQSSLTKFASAEYFTNNLLGHVYFEEASKMIPDGAIVIEIAPHGLLQAIVRKSLNNCTHIPLTKRGVENPVKFFIEAIGRLYQCGLNPAVDTLYPKINYPVSTATPLLAHFVAWEHSNIWEVAHYKKPTSITMAARKYKINIQDDEWKFLRGYLRNGINVLPESVLLVLAWKTLAMYNNLALEEMPVIFEDLQFYQELIFDEHETTHVDITIQKGTNRFEVTSAETWIVSGIIKKDKNANNERQTINAQYNDTDVYSNEKDIYSMLNIRGHHYGPEFRLIQILDHNFNKAKLKWTGNWITFMDSLIQLHLILNNDEGVLAPKLIQKLKIDPREYEVNEDTNSIHIEIDANLYVSTRCLGVSLDDVKFNNKPIGLHKLPCKELKINSDTTIQISYIGCQSLQMYRCKDNKISVVDYSGIKQSGERVMGIISIGAISYIEENDIFADLMWPVPKHWTIEDAATVILPYTQAYYCLIIRGKINEKRGLTASEGTTKFKVLIVNGDETFGQAAISVCLECNCSVFTIVSSDLNKQLLSEIFPQLQDKNIKIATNENFYEVLGNDSENNLCDFVINNGSGILRENAMKCLGNNGFFVDMSTLDMEKNADFGMSFLNGVKNYVSVQPAYLFEKENLKERQIIQKLIQNGIENETIKPFKRAVCENKVTTNNFLDTTFNNLNDATAIFKSNNEIGTKGLKENINTKVEAGFEAFYSFVDDAEWVATDPLVPMTTLLSDKSIQYNGEINPEETFLIMIPGFEGHNRIFKLIASRLKIQAMTLQIGPDTTEDSIEDIAKNLFTYVKKTLNRKSHFYLLGYSFGVNVALEIAVLLEKEGHIGTVYCLDSSPDVLKIQIDACLGNLTNNQLQTAVIKHIYKTMTGKYSEELEKNLDGIKEWSRKVEMCVAELKNVVTNSHEYIRMTIESAYKKIILAKDYKPDLGLKSKLVLIKGIGDVHVSEDYNLSKFTVNSSVDIYNIHSNFVSAPEDSNVANIINKTLDPKLIEKYNEANLCEKYFIKFN